MPRARRVRKKYSPQSNLPKPSRGTGNRQRTKGDVDADIVRAERRAKVLEYRQVYRFTFDRIGQVLGISGELARKDFVRAFAEWVPPNVVEYRRAAEATTDAVITRNALVAQMGMKEGSSEFDKLRQVRADKLIIQAQALHARILGYEAPNKIEHTGPHGGPIPVGVVDLETVVSTAKENEERLERARKANG